MTICFMHLQRTAIAAQKMTGVHLILCQLRTENMDGWMMEISIVK